MAVPKPKSLDRDCTAAKAGKNMAMKATVGVGDAADKKDVHLYVKDAEAGKASV